MDIFDRIIFVSFEQAGGGHRIARTLAAMPEHYWYSHPDNGIHPWNIHFTHTSIRQRYAAKAHFDRIVPLGKLPPTWDYVSDFFPDPATYYGLFYKKFLEVAPDTDKKFLYCTHSTPSELRKFFPKSKIINIINDKEVIPELLQKECNAEEIYKTVTYFLKNPELIEKQLVDCKKTLEGIKSKSSSSSEAALILNNYLIS